MVAVSEVPEFENLNELLVPGLIDREAFINQVIYSQEADATLIVKRWVSIPLYILMFYVVLE